MDPASASRLPTAPCPRSVMTDDANIAEFLTGNATPSRRPESGLVAVSVCVAVR
jgi:hypothetical protein